MFFLDIVQVMFENMPLLGFPLTCMFAQDFLILLHSSFYLIYPSFVHYPYLTYYICLLYMKLYIFIGNNDGNPFHHKFVNGMVDGSSTYFLSQNMYHCPHYRSKGLLQYIAYLF